MVGVMTAILVALIAPVLIASAQTPSAGERFLVSPVREWTYELQVHGSLGVHFDPYFVNSVLLESSLSHGSRRNSNDGKSVTFTLRAPAKPLNGEQQLELDEAAKKAFFGPAVTKASLVVVRSVDPLAGNHPWNFKGLDGNGVYKPLLPFPHPVLALEIRGAMDMKKDDPWILSEVLALIPSGLTLAGFTIGVKVEPGKVRTLSIGGEMATIVPKPDSTKIDLGTLGLFFARRRREVEESLVGSCDVVCRSLKWDRRC